MIEKYLIEIDTDENLKGLDIGEVLRALEGNGVKVKSITEVK